MKISYDIADVAPYINWVYFYYAWGMHDKPDEEKQKLRQEAEAALVGIQGRYRTYALFQLFDANSDGDDILVSPPPTGATSVFNSPPTGGVPQKCPPPIGGDRGGHIRIPFLRQQQPDSEFRCLSDFVRPLSSGLKDRVGVFATTVDIGLETDFEKDEYQKMMMQLLADRLAEATAERMHEEVRKHYWGYASDEHLTIHEMQLEHFQGIRPAVGYPSLPDTSLNFLLNDLLDMRQIGIRLTESGAMKPHASVSGLMLAHPESRYFSVGKIGEDQLRDYARRRGLPVEVCRKFLAANLA